MGDPELVQHQKNFILPDLTTNPPRTILLVCLSWSMRAGHNRGRRKPLLRDVRSPVPPSDEGGRHGKSRRRETSPDSRLCQGRPRTVSRRRVRGREVPISLMRSRRPPPSLSWTLSPSRAEFAWVISPALLTIRHHPRLKISADGPASQLFHQAFMLIGINLGQQVKIDSTILHGKGHEEGEVLSQFIRHFRSASRGSAQASAAPTLPIHRVSSAYKHSNARQGGGPTDQSWRAGLQSAACGRGRGDRGALVPFLCSSMNSCRQSQRQGERIGVGERPTTAVKPSSRSETCSLQKGGACRTMGRLGPPPPLRLGLNIN